MAVKLNSDINHHIFWMPDGSKIENETYKGGWYFWDEAGLIGGGPYISEQEAIYGLNRYVSWLNNEQ